MSLGKGMRILLRTLKKTGGKLFVFLLPGFTLNL